MIPIFIYITQYGITLINQPQRGGKKMTTRLAEKAAGKKLFESTVSGVESTTESSSTSSASTASSTASVAPE
ncbi:hypothetical protein ScalyP_jg8159 [Parmales sp. scaly parma]|nr:hypothetical protein ScalyP_jg8159 [Parmales sp. scaly parma]